jgi:hypothetical protein
VLTDELAAYVAVEPLRVDRWRAQAPQTPARLMEAVLERTATPTHSSSFRPFRRKSDWRTSGTGPVDGGYETLEAYLEHVSLMDLDRGSAADPCRS